MATAPAPQDPPVPQMLLEGAQDAVLAFKLLRMAVADDPRAVEVADAHISQLEYAIAKAKRAELLSQIAETDAELLDDRPEWELRTGFREEDFA